MMIPFFDDNGMRDGISRDRGSTTSATMSRASDSGMLLHHPTASNIMQFQQDAGGVTTSSDTLVENLVQPRTANQIPSSTTSKTEKKRPSSSFAGAAAGGGGDGSGPPLLPAGEGAAATTFTSIMVHDGTVTTTDDPSIPSSSSPPDVFLPPPQKRSRTRRFNRRNSKTAAMIFRDMIYKDVIAEGKHENDDGTRTVLSGQVRTPITRTRTGHHNRGQPEDIVDSAMKTARDVIFHLVKNQKDARRR